MTPASPDNVTYTTARYGMFVHYGLYSLLGRGEWALNREGIPIEEYKALAGRFDASRFDADAICDLAVRAGMRYIVFTTMHHDGFCLYDTQLTNFNSVRACGRDLTTEIIAAARRRGLKIALYHSLNEWTTQPDGVAALESKEAHAAFVDRAHARIRELVTRYNPIDVLWYDGWWPFNAEGWRGEAMNEMVRAIQPHILFNGRNGLPGDFSTPEGHLGSPQPWRPWEACITHNSSWGFNAGDHDWKTAWQVVEMLATVAAGQGNLLLNIGPHGDGSVPAPSVQVLEEVGAWLARNGECIFDTASFTYDLQERGDHRADWGHVGPYTARDHADGTGSFYLLARRWPGETHSINGLECEVRRVSLLGTDREFAFSQQGGRLTVTGLPALAPDQLCPVLRFDCDRPASLYLTGGLRTPRAAHPRYDPCPSDIAH